MQPYTSYLLLLAVLWERAYATFYSILSVHTTQTPYCPKVYSPDPSYIGCCGAYQTIAYAPGPDGSQSPGCCMTGAMCTNAPPIMYDWTLDDLGYAVIVTPRPATAKPTTSAAAATPVQHGSTLATAVQTNAESPTTPTGPSSGSNSGSGGGSGLGTGAMIGIAVSAASLVVGVIGILVRIWLAKKKQKDYQ